jgi:mannose-1-phosphate guanylyltransferase / mannose-6-phosphate isomerase
VTISLIPAVMSGGSGTRLWPLSTEALPKQFHALGSSRSMIQDTVRRLAAPGTGLTVADPMLIANRRHGDLVESQLSELGGVASAIVLEPFGRNTAAVAAIASLLAQEADPDALVLLMPADHVINDAEGFASTIARCAPAARERIVTFGVTPTAPETGYGYIQAGNDLGDGVRTVVRFAEKPDLATAQAYVDEGSYLWNAGIFLFSPAVLLAEMERLQPEVARASAAALEASTRRGPFVDLDDAAFAKVPSISIDYAVMEHTDKAAVAPIGADWADVGSWSELWRLGPRDDAGNFLKGEPLMIDATDCLVWAQGRTVGVIGVSDLVVVATDEAVIVLPKSRAQDVKLLVEQLKARRAADQKAAQG